MVCAVRTWVTNLVQDIGGARVGWGGAVVPDHNSFEDCIAHAKAQSRKKARKECREGFLNSEGQAGPVVDEVVLGDAAGRYRAFPTVAIGGHSRARLDLGSAHGKGQSRKKGTQRIQWRVAEFQRPGNLQSRTAVRSLRGIGLATEV